MKHRMISRLMPDCVIAILAILIPTTLHAEPAGPGDWSKVRLFGHAFRNDDYTPAQYDFIRDHFHIFTIEKRHAKNVYGATSTEKAAAETAKKLLKNNPDMRALLYWSTNTAYNRFYSTVRDTVAEHPDWVEEVRKGTIIANDYSFYSWGGVKNSYAADDSLIYWSEDFGNKLGKPLGKATKDGYAYHRDFEHCSVDVDLKAKTSSIVWKPGA